MASETTPEEKAKGKSNLQAALLLVLLPVLVFLLAFVYLLRKRGGKHEAPKVFSSRPKDLPWEDLFENADRVVKETTAALPKKIQAEAKKVPCILEKWPPEGEEFLGLYTTFEPNVVSEAPGPIMLYLGSIYQECAEYNLDFGEEVKITFLHELGHHLGLDEDALDERGLGLADQPSLSIPRQPGRPAELHPPRRPLPFLIIPPIQSQISHPHSKTPEIPQIPLNSTSRQTRHATLPQCP